MQTLNMVGNGLRCGVLVCVFSLAGGHLACNRSVAGGRADGARVFAEVCARCHGESGTPIAVMAAQLGVKDLTDPKVVAGLSDDAIRKQISEGSDNKRMPAFKGTLTSEQIDALVGHVRSLSATGSRPARAAD